MRRVIFVLLAMLAAPAAAQHAVHQPPGSSCTEVSLRCASAVTPWAAPDGTLWLAFAAAGQVAVARAEAPGWVQVVSGPPAAIDDNGEARPKVFADGKGLVLVTWTVRKEQAFSGQAWIARSADGGRSFEPARPLSNDPVSQRFEVAGLLPDGTLVLVWIDKRAGAAAKRAGQAYAGAAVVAAWSKDGGRTFEREQVVADHSCECCRLALAPTGDGGLALAWRHVFEGGVRDHAVARLDAKGLGAPARLAVDDWPVQACPHHGPALTVAADGGWHAAWFTKGRARQGLFGARSMDGGQSWSQPEPIGDQARRPGHPALLAAPSGLWRAWKEFDGETSAVKVQHSGDGGVSWDAARVVATTAEASDHPQLVNSGGRAMLSWASRAEGWRLLGLEGP
ncbi:sialidase family protein [Magnetospirillum moscoviense]|uniref:Glycosyl hydrolase n=1 Tax=Magnetospirillum moscoviense TaxID=1437059 RepID=A0A178MYH9_9PROT|nr:sialidase family protein [Magnetospirillum moscoviense]OAN63213.1 hypothetical protein A6A05_06590 [Magnetospirillum moscoviense]